MSILRQGKFTPDEIAIPLTSGALRLIDKPADDVIRLYRAAQAAADAAYAENRGRGTARARALAAVSDFRFSTLQGEHRPWHTHSMTNTSHITYLVDRIMDAAFVVISYFVGMRAGEILGLQAGCLQPRSPANPTDPPDSFYIRGKIFKTSRSPAGDPHRWAVPRCVARAITVVERLSEPLRMHTGRPDLWLATSVKGLRTPVSSCTQLTTSAMNTRLNEKFAPFIDLPLYQGKPWHLSTHQGRKTFAAFVGRRDHTGLEALRSHFGHKSIAMTDSAYVGNDPSLAELVDEHIEEESQAALVDLLTASEIAGPAGQRIARNLQFRGRTADPDVIDFAKFLREDLQLTLGPCDWGYCLFRRLTSACHGGDSGPNPVFRNQNTCASCHNFAVTRRHLPVWEDRLARNRALLERPDLTPTTRAVAQHRANQCQEILEQLNASPKLAEESDAEQNN